MQVFDSYSGGSGLIDDYFFADHSTPASFIIGRPFQSIAAADYTPQQVRLPLDFSTPITGSVTVQLKEADATGMPTSTVVASGSVVFNTSNPATFSAGSILISVTGSGRVVPGSYYTVCAACTIDQITGLTDYCRLKGLAFLHTAFGSLLTSVDGVTWTVFQNPLHSPFGRGYLLQYSVWGELYVEPEPPAPAPPTFPPTRPDDYAPDDFWIPGQWDGGTYTPPEWGQPTDGRYFATGGGRWGIQLVAVGHGKVYYEELT